MKNVKISPVLIAAALLVTGCQGGESKDGNSASQSPAKESCEEILSAETKEAMKRIGDIPPSAKATFLGDPQRTIDWLVGEYDAGASDGYRDIDFCGAYKGSAGLDSVMISFSLAKEAPEEGKSASIFKEYSMGKAALAGVKVGVLYFECSSKKFAAGAGATVLVRAEVRNRYSEVTESEAAAREDNLRIVYESSRALSSQLQCKSNSGLSADFKMPPEL